MSVSRYPQITEELLSAYLDNTVSEEERRLIEHAIRVEPRIAWQLESLRQTVQLLNSLPAIALPRVFTLNQVLLEEKLAAEQARTITRRVVQTAPVGVTWWQRWLTIWQNGSPYLRNGAVAALLLLAVLVAGNQLLSPAPRSPAPRGGETMASAPAADNYAVATPVAVAVVITQGAEPQENVEQSAAEVSATEHTQVPPAAERALKPLVTEAATSAVRSTKSTVMENSAPTVVTMPPATLPADGPPAENITPPGGAVADTATFQNPARISGDDTQPLLPEGMGAAGQPFSAATQADPSMASAQDNVAPQTDVAMETSSTSPTAGMTPATEIVELGEPSGEAVVVVAAVADATTMIAATVLVATPTMTATATVTPTNTATATATMTPTVNPTVTGDLQGVVPPQVQAMQVTSNMATAVYILFTQLTATITLAVSLLWWRSQPA